VKRRAALSLAAEVCGILAVLLALAGLLSAR
jgi:hypothetical protein